MIQVLEDRKHLSVWVPPDVAPADPTNFSAQMVVVNGVKKIRLKWTDNSADSLTTRGESYFQIWVAKGKHPFNGWKIATNTPYLNYTRSTGRVQFDVPYVAGMSWNTRGVRITPPAPKTDIHIASGMASYWGVFVP